MAIHPNDDSYPEYTVKYIEELGLDMEMSKGIISLKNDRGTSYEMYIAVQDELASAFHSMKDELSLRLYGLKFDQLINKDETKAINKAVPVRVSEAEPEDIGGK